MVDLTEPVPCNGCTLCCRHDVILLYEEEGDDVSSYETEDFTVPFDGKDRPILKHTPDGGCFYLGEKGCTIYERRPAICRAFDCRKWFLKHTRTERRIMLRAGLADKAIFDRGRDLLKQR